MQMNDPKPTDPPETDPPGDPAPTDPPGDPAPTDPPKASDSLKADLARERKARQASEKELEKLRQAGMTDADRLKSERDTAVKESDKYRREALQLRVASELGLPPGAASRLVGDTEEELLADGKALASMLKSVDEKDKKRPPADGGKSGPGKTAQDMNALLRAAARGV